MERPWCSYLETVIRLDGFRDEEHDLSPGLSTSRYWRVTSYQDEFVF